MGTRIMKGGSKEEGKGGMGRRNGKEKRDEGRDAERGKRGRIAR